VVAIVALPTASQNWLILPWVLADAIGINTDSRTISRNTIPVRFKIQLPQKLGGRFPVVCRCHSYPPSPRIGGVGQTTRRSFRVTARAGQWNPKLFMPLEYARMVCPYL
jgi:hypothetical protein